MPPEGEGGGGGVRARGGGSELPLEAPAPATTKTQTLRPPPFPNRRTKVALLRWRSSSGGRAEGGRRDLGHPLPAGGHVGGLDARAVGAGGAHRRAAPRLPAHGRDPRHHRGRGRGGGGRRHPGALPWPRRGRGGGAVVDRFIGRFAPRPFRRPRAPRPPCGRRKPFIRFPHAVVPLPLPNPAVASVGRTPRWSIWVPDSGTDARRIGP